MFSEIRVKMKTKTTHSYKIKLLAILLIPLVWLAPIPKADAARGSAYCLIDASDNTVLKQSNSNTRLPMASTTKVMTAILALENIPIDYIINVKKEYTGIEGSSMYLREGDRYTVYDVLCGLMMVSGNDAAVALACSVAGSEEAFVDLMNQKAAELGLRNTHFTNPHGLHNSDHYTTAYDLAVICSYAMKNEQFAEIVGRTESKIIERKANNVRILYNKNKFLTRYDGANGIKIGYTKDAGRCLCAGAERDGRQLICVILNDSNWFNTAMYLMDNEF